MTTPKYYVVACTPNCQKCDTGGFGACDSFGCARGYSYLSDLGECHGECLMDVLCEQINSSATYGRFNPEVYF